MSTPNSQSSNDFIPALIGDGRPLLSLTGIALIIAGGFAIFLSATGAFLPRDVDSFDQAMAIAGSAGFICAIIVHVCIGYLVIVHVAPACMGALIFIIGMFLIANDCLSTKTIVE